MAVGRPSVWSADTTWRASGAPGRSRWPGESSDVLTLSGPSVHEGFIPSLSNPSYSFTFKWWLSFLSGWPLGCCLKTLWWCVPSPATVCWMRRKMCWSCSSWKSCQRSSCLLTTAWGSWWGGAPTWAGPRPPATLDSSGRTYTELWRAKKATMTTHTSCLGRSYSLLEYNTLLGSALTC